MTAGMTYLEMEMAAGAASTLREVAKVNKPVDKAEWGMLASQVNAYYEPTKHEMVFPASILQPPFFDDSAPSAYNYGAVGAVMGHELTHSLDDQGRQYDSKGTLKNWWDAKSVAEFDTRAKAVEELYSSHEFMPGKKLNGKNSLGENLADMGGLRISFQAWQKASAAGVAAPP